MRFLLAVACALLLAGGNALASESPTWELVWSDEFDGPTVDRAKWYVENAALDKNNEGQYYDPEEVFTRDGTLVLRSRKRTKGDRLFTSGLVETKGTFSQTYGWFEVRAKLPKGQGIWPAHWMMPADNSWPPEIDIMELIGHDPTTIHMTHHYGKWPDTRLAGNSFTGPDFSQDFHVFSVQWEPDAIRWYVDSQERSVQTENIPDVPMRIILNTAVGGDWPGYPDETTIFPQEHVIDYVRVYRKSDGAGSLPEKPDRVLR